MSRYQMMREFHMASSIAGDSTIIGMTVVNMDAIERLWKAAEEASYAVNDHALTDAVEALRDLFGDAS